MSDIKLVSLQTGLFFNKVVTRPDEYVTSLNTACQNIFDALPIVLPIPEDAPPEIPVAQLNSKLKKYASNIGRRRADLFINETNTILQENTISQHFPLVEKFIEFFLRDNTFSRIAFVAKYFSELTNIEESIKKNTNSKIVELHSGKPFFSTTQYTSTQDLGEFHIINFTLIEKATYMEKEGFMITRDINTNPSSNYSEKLKKDECVSLINESLSLHKVASFFELLS